MEFDYGALTGGMNLDNLAASLNVGAGDIDIGGFNDLVNKDMMGNISLDGATDLYGSGLTGGIDFGAITAGDMAKNIVPATSPVLGIPGVDAPIGGDLFGGNWDGAGRMAELNGIESMMANRPAMDPSLTTMEAFANDKSSDIYGMLSKGTKGLGGLMGLYNSWQMMNIMKNNERRNQQGFDLANQRYDTNHANVKKAFAV